MGNDDDTDDPVGGGPDAGTPDDDPDTGSTAQALFQQNIQPMVAGCGTTGCHTGSGTDPLKFLGTGTENQYYTSIVQYAQVHGNWNVQQASMVTKLEIAAENGEPHYGYEPWTPDQLALIEEWFAAEAEERAGEDPVDDPGDGPVDTRTLFAQWSACMTLDNWNQSQMGDWSEKGTNNGECGNCHNDGQFWININPDNDTMFEMNRYELFIMGFFAAKMNPDGTGEIVPAYDKLVRVGQGNQGGSLHPTFNTDVENDPYFQYLEEFYQLTKTNLEAGNCGPAGFPDPNGGDPQQ